MFQGNVRWSSWARVVIIFVIIAIIALLSAGCRKGTKGEDQGKSILLITIDTWRWDHIGASGAGKVETPVLDSLASGGMYLYKVQSTCPMTTPAHGTILTGLYPSRHGIRDNLHFKLKDGIPTVASLLSSAGYRCAAVVSAAPLKRVYGLDAGFEEYLDSDLGNESEESSLPSSRNAEQTTRMALGKLAELGGSGKVFMWVHYFDPHYPYAPPEPFLSNYKSKPYAGEVAFVDSKIGELIAGLPGGKEKWDILITGDHGEGLGDHGERAHGVTLYESTIEVPLVMWPKPASKPPDGGHASLVDVFPTLCSLAGIPAGDCDGKSLLAGIPKDRLIASESAYPTLAFRLNPIFSLRKGDMIWFRHGEQEVYDLASDPEQVNNIFGQGGAEFAAECEGSMEPFFGPDPLASLLDLTISPDVNRLNEILALGYIGGKVPTGTSEIQKMDARAFIQDLNGFFDARAIFFSGDYKKALPGYHAFLLRYPDSYFALREMGIMQTAGASYKEAISTFSRALALDPTDAASSMNLGNLYFMKGEFVKAESLFTLSLKSDESQPNVHLSLAKMYLGPLNKPQKAASHIRRFLELKPGDAEASAMRAELSRLEAPQE